MRRVLRTAPTRIVSLALSAMLAHTAFAQTTGAPPNEQTMPSPALTSTMPGLPPLRLAGAVDPREYRLGPGDRLQMLLRGRVSRTVPLEVDPEGGLTLPGLPAFQVSGRTLAQVSADVVQRMQSQVRGVDVDLRLERPRVFQAYLAGQVRLPGPVPVLGSSRVADVLNDSLMLANGSRRRIEVVSRDGTRRIADLVRFYASGDASFNPQLVDGDIVLVPVAREFVYAFGAVARPGRIERGEADSVRTLLAVAGGLLPSAAPERALLVRWKDAHVADSTWIDVRDVLSGASNPVVGNEDHLYVYYQPHFREQQEATVIGEVQRPGAYPIEDGRTRLTDLVREAGGFTPLADLASIRIHRVDGVTGEPDPELERLLRLSRNEQTASEYEGLRTKLSSRREDYRVSWGLLQKSPEALDVLMRDGDVVRVEKLVRSIRIDGEVRHPGILTYRPGDGIDDYVRNAGGFTSRAWRSKIRLTRAVTGQTLLARNANALDAGDFIWVPERPDRTVWEQAKDVLGTLAGIATIIIAIRTLK